jgi:hypothetical protein
MTSDETLRKDYARRVNSAWRKSVAAIIEAGRILVEAKTKLKPGTFMEMIRADLAFDVSTAERLMKIARTPWLVESATLPILPASWTTLYALTQLTKKEFAQAQERGLITSDLTLFRAERLKGALVPESLRIERWLDKQDAKKEQHTCTVVAFAKPDDVVELKTAVERDVVVEVEATLFLGYLRQALDRIERCDDDEEEAALVDAVIKHKDFQDTMDAFDHVLETLKQAAAAAAARKPSLVAVNNDAPLH